MDVPTTLAEADALRAWALSDAVDVPKAATHDQPAKHLDFMAAAPPSRNNDAETGRKHAAVYASILAGQTNETLAFMARRAFETLEWFPSPKQCLDLLASFLAPPTP